MTRTWSCLLVLLAVPLGTLPPAAAQTVTPLNERMGMYSCTCADGRNAGPVIDTAIAIAWQRYDALNSRMNALSGKLQRCLRTESGAADLDCTLARSEEASLRGQLASIVAQAQSAGSAARTQCTAVCLTRTIPSAPVNRGAGASGDSNTRPLVVDPVKPAIPRSLRVDVEPRYKPWVPAFMKAMVNRDAAVSLTLKNIRGNVAIRRGDRQQALETLRQAGINRLLLQPGDEIVLGNDGHIDVDLGDHVQSYGPNSSIQLGRNNCLRGGDVVRIGDHPEKLRLHLLRGTVRYATTGEATHTDEGPCRNAVHVPSAVTSPRGTIFTQSYTSDGQTASLTVAVEQGAVDVVDFFGEATSIGAGRSQTLQYSRPALLKEDDPIARAINRGEVVDAGGRWFVPVGATGVWLDRRQWTLGGRLAERGNVVAFSSAGTIQGSLVGLPQTVDADEMRRTIVGTAQALNPGATLRREEWRKIGAVHVFYLELQLPGEQSLLAQCFSGAQGTTYLTLLVSDTARAAGRAQIDAVLNGFVAVDPSALPPE